MARYSGKYRRKKRTMPLASWVLILMAVLSLSTGAVVAYLAAYTTVDVTNSFDAAASKNPVIVESMIEKELTKSSVAVQPDNPGYAVYVRAAVLVNWKDKENGNVLAQAPVAGIDYEVDTGDSGWFEHGGFYYYAEMVKDEAGDDITANLIDAITVLKPAPEADYTLNVEIITQTIQALGTTDADNTPAVTSAWGIPVVAKKLTPPTP